MVESLQWILTSVFPIWMLCGLFTEALQWLYYLYTTSRAVTTLQKQFEIESKASRDILWDWGHRRNFKDSVPIRNMKIKFLYLDSSGLSDKEKLVKKFSAALENAAKTPPAFNTALAIVVTLFWPIFFLRLNLSVSFDLFGGTWGLFLNKINAVSFYIWRLMLPSSQAPRTENNPSDIVIKLDKG